MRICLVTAVTTDRHAPQTTMQNSLVGSPPLGVLTVAACLESRGIAPTVFDLDHAYAAWRPEPGEPWDTDRFVARAAASLSSVDAEAFGFSTICSSYPTTLLLAAAMKRMRRDARMILGGPQASAVAEETLHAFPAVDIIVRGEAEAVLPRLMEALETGETLDTVPGISYRMAGKVRRNPDAPIIEDLDSFPLPAFHLDPHIKDRHSLALELGRGCPFACTFCSTSDFFRRRYRLKSPQRVVEQMVHLHGTYGISHFDLVHDNFAVNRDRAVEFCTALIASRARFRWGCSARTDCVDDELLDLMRKAGCYGVFFGVECGSARMQAVIGKRLDVEEARKRIRHASRRKLAAAAALITGFPDETAEDLRKTVHFFVDALRFDYVEPQLGLLSPLSGTAIYQLHRDELVYDDVVSDVAFQGLEQDPADRELIAAHPTVFSSFYSVPTRWLDRRYLQELRYFLLYGAFHLRWLVVGVHQATSDILQVFDAWRAWRSTHSSPDASESIAAYYAGPGFRNEFISFVRTELALLRPEAALALKVLSDYYANLQSPVEEIPGESGAGSRMPAGERDRPVRAPGIRVVHVEADCSQIIRCLRRRASLARIGRQPTTIVTRHRAGRMEMVQLSPLSAELLAFCNGRREVRQIVSRFADRFPILTGERARSAVVWGLRCLHKEGSIAILPPQGRPKRRIARTRRSQPCAA